MSVERTEGRTFGQAFATLVLLVVGFFLLVPSFLGCGGGNFRDAGVRANVSTVAMALEQYATDHGGKYPPSERLVAELTRERRNYLPGNRMPRSPWGRKSQTLSLRVAGTGLPTAGQVAAGAKPAARGALVGKGEEPQLAPTNAYQYGAVLYDLDPKTQTYVLYGVGQQNKRAEVVAVASSALLGP